MIDTIYLDMDGVICDFDKSYSSIFGLNCRDDPDKSNWDKFVSNKGFFNLEPCKGFTDLIDSLYTYNVDVVILSCAGNKPDHNQVRKQKIDWLMEYNLGHLDAHFTRTKLQKADFARKSSLLIDDSRACIDPFKEKNGYGILHTSAKQTIIELGCLRDKGLLCALSLDQTT